MKIKNLKLNEIMSYILMIVVLLSSGTPMLAAYYQPVSFCFLFCSFLNFLVARTIISKKMTLITITLIALLMMTMIVNGDTAFMHYIGIAIYIVSTFMLTEAIELNAFIKMYIRIITIISVYSLLLTLYSNLNLRFPGTLPVITAGNNKWYHISIFYNYWGWSQWSSFIRNAACFREPGVWGCYVTLALILELNGKDDATGGKDKKRLSRLIVLILGAISSFSTTAIFCLIITVGTYYVRNTKVTGKKLFLVFVGVVGFICLLIFQGERLFSKFNSTSSSYVSFQERSDGIKAGFSMFLQNPLFGSGYSKYINNIVGTSANSYVDLLGKYGILFTGIIVFGLVLYVKSVKRNILVKLFVVIFLAIALGTQNILIYPVFMSISFYGLKNKR